jgi:hypothetical protein
VTIEWDPDEELGGTFAMQREERGLTDPDAEDEEEDEE